MEGLNIYDIFFSLIHAFIFALKTCISWENVIPSCCLCIKYTIVKTYTYKIRSTMLNSVFLNNFTTLPCPA